jgi:hypothetical protein
VTLLAFVMAVSDVGDLVGDAANSGVCAISFPSAAEISR